MNTAISESLANLRNMLTTWYMALDERTQYYFDAAYTENRRAITNALGGYTVTADELSQHSTLAALFGVDADGEPADILPHIVGAFGPVTDPPTPVANQSFKLEWVDINYGTPSPGYDDIVLIHDSANTYPFEGKVEVGALDHNSQTSVQVEVHGLDAGTYSVKVIHNANGADPEFAGFAQKSIGLRSFTDFELTVAAAPAN